MQSCDHARGEEASKSFSLYRAVMFPLLEISSSRFSFFFSFLVLHILEQPSG